MSTAVLLFVHHNSTNNFLNNYLNNITAHCKLEFWQIQCVCVCVCVRGEHMAVTRLKPANLITKEYLSPVLSTWPWANMNFDCCLYAL